MTTLTRHLFCLAVGVISMLGVRAGAIEPTEVFSVWPAKPPGQTQGRGPEKLVEGRPRPFYQITDVSTPTVSVYLPPKEKRTGAAVLVLPGGGLQRLAIEHEGIEVADWLTSQNISVFVLKYRVPERARVALQDAQRALRVIRARAGEWSVDPDDIGVVGFSAGAEVAVWLATQSQEHQYEAIDASDALSCRPAYATIVYPGGLLQGGPLQVKEGIENHLNADTPPMFVAQAYDDSSENSLALMAALKRAKVPAELHIYQEGGHGFGVRETGAPVGGWKESWREWLQWQGFLDGALVRNYAREAEAAMLAKGNLPRLAEKFPNATMADAYNIQKRVVRARVLGKDHIAGFKCSATDSGAPINAVLFRSGELKSGEIPPIEAVAGETQIAMGVGYRISVDMSTKIANDTQVQGAVSAVLPVVELPVNFGKRMEAATALEKIAVNDGSGRFVVGASKPPTSLEDKGVKFSMKRNGLTVQQGETAATRRWTELRTLLNQITAQGYTLHAGDLIFLPSEGKLQSVEPGKYEADFGSLGTVAFELK